MRRHLTRVIMPRAGALALALTLALGLVGSASAAPESAAAAACRRVANSEDAPARLIERCRTALVAPGDGTDAAAVCRRLVAQGSEAPDTLIERCREVLGDGRERNERNAPTRTPVRTPVPAAGGV